MNMPRKRRGCFPRAIRQSLAGTVLVVLAVLAPVSAASAHDVLTGTNPKDGQTVRDMSDVIDLTFSNMPLAIGTRVRVEDADGKDWPSERSRSWTTWSASPCVPRPRAWNIR